MREFLRYPKEELSLVTDSTLPPGAVDLSWRDAGPIQYEIELLRDPTQWTRLPDTLLNSGLYWCWYQGSGPHVLTPQTVDDFRSCLRPAWPVISLYGADTFQEAEAILDPLVLRKAMEVFSAEEAKPLRIVVLQNAEQEPTRIFVPHNPVAEVVHLLDTWGVRPDAIHRTYQDSSRRGWFERLAGLPSRPS